MRRTEAALKRCLLDDIAPSYPKSIAQRCRSHLFRRTDSEQEPNEASTSSSSPSSNSQELNEASISSSNPFSNSQQPSALPPRVKISSGMIAKGMGLFRSSPPAKPKDIAQGLFDDLPPETMAHGMGSFPPAPPAQDFYHKPLPVRMGHGMSQAPGIYHAHCSRALDSDVPPVKSAQAPGISDLPPLRMESTSMDHQPIDISPSVNRMARIGSKKAGIFLSSPLAECSAKHDQPRQSASPSINHHDLLQKLGVLLAKQRDAEVVGNLPNLHDTPARHGTSSLALRTWQRGECKFLQRSL